MNNDTYVLGIANTISISWLNINDEQSSFTARDTSLIEEAKRVLEEIASMLSSIPTTANFKATGIPQTLPKRWPNLSQLYRRAS
jgi:hypothetical protein